MPKKKVAVDLENIEKKIVYKLADGNLTSATEGVPDGAIAVTALPWSGAKIPAPLLISPIAAKIGQWADTTVGKTITEAKAVKGKFVPLKKAKKTLAEKITKEEGAPKLKTAQKGYVTKAQLFDLTSKIGYDIKNAVDFAVEEYVVTLEKRVAELESKLKDK